MPSFLQSESESVADNQWGASVAEARPPIGQQPMQFSFSYLLMQLKQRLHNMILVHVLPTKMRLFCVSCIHWKKSCGYFKTDWNASYNLKVGSFVLCSNQFVHSSFLLHKCSNIWVWNSCPAEQPVLVVQGWLLIVYSIFALYRDTKTIHSIMMIWLVIFIISNYNLASGPPKDDCWWWWCLCAGLHKLWHVLISWADRGSCAHKCVC